MKKNSIKGVCFTAIFLLLSSLQVHAISLDYGQLVGVWEAPNDTSDVISSYLTNTNWALSEGQMLTELARNNDVFYSDGLVNVPLTPNVFSYETGESTNGLWAYFGGSKVDFLAVATSSHFALYSYDSPQWLGLWTTEAISSFIQSADQGMTHITAYSLSAVPLPAAAPLFLSALALFGFLNHKRRNRKS